MTALLAIILFGTALAASVWTLYASIRPQLHRYRALFVPPVSAELPMRPTRVTVRWAAPRPAARLPLRQAA